MQKSIDILAFVSAVSRAIEYSTLNVHFKHKEEIFREQEECDK